MAISWKRNDKLFLRPIKLLFCSQLYTSFACKTLMQLSPFLMCFPYHRSPLQGTHGDRVAGDNTRSRHNQCHSLIVPLRFVRRLRNNMAQSLVLYVKSDARFARRRCGSCSVFEVAHSVNKYAPNRLSFWAQLLIIHRNSALRLGRKRYRTYSLRSRR